MKSILQIMSVMALTTGLIGCGGGGGGTSAPVTNAAIEGVWNGTSSSGYVLNTLVLENGSTYVMFGTQVGNTLTVLGFDQGTVGVNGNSFSGSVREYLYTGASAAGTVSGTTVAGTSISGSTVYGSTTTTFNLTPSTSSTYSYNTPATLTTVAGNWTGAMLNGTSASISINSGTGAIAGSNSGCSFSGTATPRASGKNVYDVSITFGTSPCVLPGQTATGNAIAYGIQGTSLTQLLVAVQDSTKANGTMFIAQR